MVIIFCFSFSFGTATHREEGCSNEWTLGGDRQGGLCRRGTRARILPRPQGLPSRETFVRGLDEPAGARQEAHDRGIFSQCPHELGMFELEMKVFLCKILCQLSSFPFAGLHNVCDVVQQYSIRACQSGVQDSTQGRHCGRRSTRNGRLGRRAKT